jgi:hypothetical protein
MFELYLIILYQIFILIKLSFDFLIGLVLSILPDPDSFSDSHSVSGSFTSISEKFFILSKTHDIKYCFPNVFEPNIVLHDFICFLESTGSQRAFLLLLEYSINNTLHALVLDGTLNAENLDDYYVFMKPKMTEEFTLAYGHLVHCP